MVTPNLWVLSMEPASCHTSEAENFGVAPFLICPPPIYSVLNLSNINL